MKRFWTTVGFLSGGVIKGWKGAAIGAALGYCLDRLVEEPLPATKERGPEAEEEAHSSHPEEELLDAMRQAESDPAVEGEEMASLYRDVVGNQPAGLVAAEIGSEEKSG